MRKKQSFLQGAAVLAGAAVLVKLIGACFKIPLGNLIDELGMADFNVAYTIFQPLNALAVAGLPVAVARLVSENAVFGRWRDVRRIGRLALALFCVTGFLGFCVMFFAARAFAALSGNPGSAVAIAALAPAVFFCCAMSAYRGYYQGLKNMYPTAVSQSVEALARFALGLALCVAFMRVSFEGRFFAGFSRLGMGETPARWGAVGAIMGIALSTSVGACFLWLRHRFCGDGVGLKELQASPAPLGRRAILRRMLAIAAPICLGSVVGQLASMIDLTIMGRLGAAMQEDAGVLLGMYDGLIESPKLAARYLYGAYGYALNIFNLVPSLTATLGVSVLPALAGAWATRNRTLVKRHIESVLRITALIAFPAGLGLSVLAQPVMRLLYGDKPVAAALLGELGVSVILVSIAAPVNAILQAVGLERAPVRLMMMGGAVKLAASYWLVSIPGVNIHGAPIGTALCYLVITVAGLRTLTRATGICPAYGRVFGKPLFAGICCAAGAWALYPFAARWIGTSGGTVLAVCAGAFIYAIVALLTRTICREDVLMLPQGEKIAKILEKHAMIG